VGAAGDHSYGGDGHRDSYGYGDDCGGNYGDGDGDGDGYGDGYDDSYSDSHSGGGGRCDYSSPEYPTKYPDPEEQEAAEAVGGAGAGHVAGAGAGSGAHFFLDVGGAALAHFQELGVPRPPVAGIDRFVSAPKCVR
jgi:hypothetical protein